MRGHRPGLSTVTLDGEQVVEALIGLVDKSVVQRIGEDGGRYRLLDTIREYGTARLTGTADAGAVRQRHFAHYDGLVDRFWNGLMGRGQVRLHHAVRAEIADVRAALEYGCGTEGRAADALWLATRLGAYWRAAGTLSEGRYWIDKGLGLAPQDSAVRAWGLFMTGVFGVWTADLETALDRFPQALDVARRIGESRVELFSEGYLGALTLLGGAVEEGSAALEAVRVRMIAADDALGIGVVHYEGALLYAALGFTDRALEWCETGLTYLEGRGERQLYGSTLTVQGVILWLVGRPEESATALRRGLEAASEIGEVLVAALASLGLAWHAAGRKRYVRACWLLGYAEHARRLGGDPVGMLPGCWRNRSPNSVRYGRRWATNSTSDGGRRAPACRAVNSWTPYGRTRTNRPASPRPAPRRPTTAPPTPSPAVNARSPRSSPRACPTGRSPNGSSSPNAPWTPMSSTSSPSWASPRVPRSWPRHTPGHRVGVGTRYLRSLSASPADTYVHRYPHRTTGVHAPAPTRRPRLFLPPGERRSRVPAVLVNPTAVMARRPSPHLPGGTRTGLPLSAGAALARASGSAALGPPVHPAPTTIAALSFVPAPATRSPRAAAPVTGSRRRGRGRLPEEGEELPTVRLQSRRSTNALCRRASSRSSP